MKIKTIKSSLKNKISLGVNIDHAATLRQVRGGHTEYPNLVELCQLAKKGGAQQITVHLREDRRHIQDHDVKTLMKHRILKMNLEMAVTAEMLKIALRYQPDWVCFVPEKREELTTEGGLDVVKMVKKLRPMIQKLQSKNIKVSLFIESSVDQVLASREVGADAVEFHTGRWVTQKKSLKNREWKKLVEAALVAHDLELGIHAGHGLDYQHSRLITKLPNLREVNIGHSMICYSLADGLTRVTQKMCQYLNG